MVDVQPPSSNCQLPFKRFYNWIRILNMAICSDQIDCDRRVSRIYLDTYLRAIPDNWKWLKGLNELQSWRVQSDLIAFLSMDLCVRAPWAWANLINVNAEKCLLSCVNFFFCFCCSCSDRHTCFIAHIHLRNKISYGFQQYYAIRMQQPFGRVVMSLWGFLFSAKHRHMQR